jgi:hypothetical protein
MLCYKRQFQTKARNQTSKHMHTHPRKLSPKPATAQQSDHKKNRVEARSPRSPGALIQIPDIRRRPRQAMHDGHTTGLDKEASNPALKHRVVPAEHTLSSRRCCVVGCLQLASRDDDEVFAPTARSATFRVLLSLASTMGMNVRQGDVCA